MPKRKTSPLQFLNAVKSAIEDGLVNGDGHSFLDINIYMPHFHPWNKDLIRMSFIEECSDGKHRLCLSTESMQWWMVSKAGISSRCQSFIGRGFQAQEYARRIHEWVREQDAATAPATQTGGAR